LHQMCSVYNNCYSIWEVLHFCCHSCSPPIIPVDVKLLQQV
jgi:hypothetical protein